MNQKLYSFQVTLNVLKEHRPYLLDFLKSYSKTSTGCIIFPGYKDPLGYGMLAIKGAVCMAHRLFYMMHNNRNIPHNMSIRHTCDNPSCVNPLHLVEGTTQDNVNDKMSRGRLKPSFGILNGMAKLTDEEILKLYDMYQTKQYSQSHLARLFKISTTSASLIAKGRGRATQLLKERAPSPPSPDSQHSA